MTNRSRSTACTAPRSRRRSGVALVMVLLMVAAFGGLATASVFLMSNSELFTRAAIRESDLRNAADAGLEMARSRVDKRGSTVLSDVDTLYLNSDVLDASGTAVPGVKVNVYAGRTGSSTSQFGSFLSLVAEARDVKGNKFIRRQELTAESFAKFAYWTNFETSSSGGTIYFASGDQIRGPLWTNDAISIASSGAKFWDEVRTAKTISGAQYGTFVKGYKEKQPVMALPPNSALAKLAGYASEAGYSFTAPNATNETTVLMRIEFVAANLNPTGAGADADSTDEAEGFFRVFTALTGKQRELRGDMPTTISSTTLEQCGDWHRDTTNGPLKFYPVSVHKAAWFKRHLVAGGMSSFSADVHMALSPRSIMAGANARCYPAGDPHLVAVERLPAQYPDTLSRYKGGQDTTFTPVGKNGSWREFIPTPNPVAPVIAAARPWDGRYLHPLHRSLNTGVKGVIHVKGTVAVSGVVRGRLTLYAENGFIVIIDDLRYAHDPGTGADAQCKTSDMLGMIAANDIVVADNAINTPNTVGGDTYRVLDDTKDLFVHSVVMAMKESFKVQNYNTGPSSATNCEGKANGRGCLYLTGGIIQLRRGTVGLLSGEGYIKRYSYDRCAADAPPPYFPVTGRYIDNMYLEIDPVNFNVVNYFKGISPK